MARVRTEAQRAYNRKWIKDNKQKARDANKKNYHKDPAKHRRRRLKNVFGITPEQYDFILARQKGRCGICGRLPHEAGARRLAVDHSHETDAVRGLLCFSCNTGLGNFKDDPLLTNAATCYLMANGRNNL